MGEHTSGLAACKQAFPTYCLSMAASRSSICVCVALLALVGWTNLWQPAFVPPASPSARPVASLPKLAGGAAVVFGAAPAFADNIDDAAKAFADTTYPLMEKVDWERSPQILTW